MIMACLVPESDNSKKPTAGDTETGERAAVTTRRPPRHRDIKGAGQPSGWLSRR